MWPLLRALGRLGTGAGRLAGGAVRGAARVATSPFRGKMVHPAYFNKKGNFKPAKYERSLYSQALDKGWQFNSGLDLVKTLTKEWLPQTSISATVKIIGSAQSNMSNLFFLACGIAANTNPDAFGAVRSHTISVVIIPHAKAVAVTIAHGAGGLLGTGGERGRALIKAPVPDNYTAALKWPTFLTGAVGADGAPSESLGTLQSIVNQSPQFTDKTSDPLIATTLAGANPVPQLDGMSRQSDLTQLVAAALLGECDKVPCPKTNEYTPSPSSAADRVANNISVGSTMASIIKYIFGSSNQSSSPPQIPGTVNTTKLGTLTENNPNGPAISQVCDEKTTSPLSRGSGS